MKTIKYTNWSTDIFAGFYESHLYNSDMLYYFNENDESGGEWDFYDNEDGVYTYGLFELDVAKQCAGALYSNLVQGDKRIIKDIRFISLHSPQYYNFSTDKIECEVDVDWEQLEVYIQENREDFSAYLYENFTSNDGFVSFVPNNYTDFMSELHGSDFERLSQVMIEYYILKNLDTESYTEDCIEIANETLWNYIKSIETKEAKQ